MNLLYTGVFKPNKKTKDFFKTSFDNVYYLKNEWDCIDFDYKCIDYIICNNLFSYIDISKFVNLKFVQFISAGLDRAPLNYLKEKEIIYFSASGVYSIPIAEWVVLNILEQLKNRFFFIDNQRKNKWVKDKTLDELSGKRVLLCGYGSIGKEIAKRLNGFNVFIGAIDLSMDIDDNVDILYSTNSIKEVIFNFDIIVICLPLNKETYHLFDKNLLTKVKDNALIINVSRGKIIDEEALISREVIKKSINFSLDVFEEEPLKKDSLLWSLPNVKITPHNSYVSVKNNARINELFLKNINNTLNILKETK